MDNYKELDVWKKSMRLALSVYEQTRVFPRDEVYGLTSQMRRAASSIPANIAEGSGRQHTRELIQFLHISLGSCTELETHALLAQGLGYLEKSVCDDLQEKITDVLKLLRGTIRALKTKESAGDSLP